MTKEYSVVGLRECQMYLVRCAPYSEGIAPSGNYMVAINARRLDGIDLSSIKVGHFDWRSL